MSYSNFFISKDTQNDIKSRIKLGESITKDERDILAAVEVRIKTCKERNIHYWVIDNYQYPESAYCHYCGLKVANYHG